MAGTMVVVEKMNGKGWVPTTLKEVKNGDRIRMISIEEQTTLTDEYGESEWVVTSTPHIETDVMITIDPVKE